EAFQVFKDVKKVVLDKTGTITLGKPKVVEVVPMPGKEAAKVLATAAAAEVASEHPLARAVVDRAEQEAIVLPETKDFQASPGRGVRTKVDGKTVFVGNLHFLEEEGIALASASKQIASLEEQGRTVVAVASDGELAGFIAIADTLKEDAREAIQRMRAVGLEPVMVTGDNWRTARSIASQVGIDEVLAEVLPDQKAEQVRQLQKQGYRVAMVGDGINDAPALMQADVGIAIGAGTDIAIESADVILVGDRLGGVVDAYHIGKSSFRKTVQNVSLAFAFNGIGVPAAVTGLVHPVWAMIAMAASVTIVLLNSFGGRLLTTPSPKREEVKTHAVKLEVPSMHCQGCEQEVRDAVLNVKGVKAVEVDLRRKLVSVTIGDGNEDKIRREIVKIGHTVH
ncbi:MAG: metal-transporting ATPase, partial [Dehalococcoidales bacterium]